MFLWLVGLSYGYKNPFQSHHSGYKTPQNLAEQYLENLDKITTKEERNRAILDCFQEIVDILDTKASKGDLQKELTSRLDTLMRSVDSRDKDLKRDFKVVYYSISSLENRTEALIENTRNVVQEMIQNVKMQALDALNKIIYDTITETERGTDKVAKRLDDAVKASDSTQNMLVYFILAQLVIFVFFFLVYKYQDIRNGAL